LFQTGALTIYHIRFYCAKETAICEGIAIVVDWHYWINKSVKVG